MKTVQQNKNTHSCVILRPINFKSITDNKAILIKN